MSKHMIIFISIVTLLASISTLNAQDNMMCDDDFIENQTTLMTDVEAYPAFDADSNKLDEESLGVLAEQELEAYCDTEKEPLIDGDLGIPIETWFFSESFEDVTTETAKEVDEDGDCVVGFLYVDHTHGTTFDIYAFCDLSDDGEIELTTRLLEDAETRLIIRFDPNTEYDLTQLSNEQLTQFELPITPFWHYSYSSPDYDITRSIRGLDPIRFFGYPDDIEFYLFDNDKPELQTELVFGRIEQQLSPPEFFAVELLNQPFSDYGVSVGDMVVVQLLEYEGEQIAIFITAMDS